MFDKIKQWLCPAYKHRVGQLDKLYNAVAQLDHCVEVLEHYYPNEVELIAKLKKFHSERWHAYQTYAQDNI